MNKGKSFYLKISFIILPLLVLLSVYAITDPFRVIYSYHFENYYNWQHWEVNRELVSVENLKERLAKNDIPDSYIFGNSRSLAFRCDVWESLLGDHANAYHLDAASETLYGVYSKVKYLDRQNIKIKNILWICDATVFPKIANEYDVIHIKHPDISGESKFSYQTNFVKCYFTNFFFLKHIDFLFTGKIKNYMHDMFPIVPGFFRTESYRNDYYYQKFDSLLRTDSLRYYNVFKKGGFDERTHEPETLNVVIKAKQIDMLREIKHILDKNNTQLKIVISPIYDQKKFNPADLKALTGIFGSNNVFDYSGKNEITDCKCNFYEGNHFKPYIANKIMRDIYSK